MGKVKARTTPVLPAEIWCGALRYEVIDDPDIATTDGGGSWGLVTHYAESIRLASGLKARTKAGTLAHEIMHVVFTANMDMKENGNEGLVDRTAGSLLDILVNSPGLLEYLIAIRDA